LGAYNATAGAVVAWGAGGAPLITNITTTAN